MMNNINDPYIHGMSDPQSEVEPTASTCEENNGTCCEKSPEAWIDSENKWYCIDCLVIKYQAEIEAMLNSLFGYDVSEQEWYQSADYVAHTNDDDELESIAICTVYGKFSHDID